MITTIDRLTGLPLGGPSALAPAAPSTHPASGSSPADRSAPQVSFADELATAARTRDLHLSGHALRRLEQRGIELDEGGLDRLRSALDQLASKGGRQSLVMLDQVAYVVNVPRQTVVTAVGPDDRKENVFTRIDSVVIA